MRRSCFGLGGLAVAVLLLPGISAAEPFSYTDLWDISQGSSVDGTSGALYYSSSYRSDVRDMFGGAYANIGATVTLFRDYLPGWVSVPEGFTHYVEWHTPDPVTLRSFALHAYNEGMDRRAFKQFTLYSSSSSGGPWSEVYDTGPGYTYGPGWGHIELDVTPVDAQYFRAEFIQASWTDYRAVGPRVYEFDGFDTFLDGSTRVIPEPSGTVALLSLLATFGVAFVWKRRRKAA